jgi:secondary thiamine-phosphate synthase enzyme
MTGYRDEPQIGSGTLPVNDSRRLPIARDGAGLRLPLCPAAMQQSTGMIEIATPGQGLHEITREVAGWVEARAFSEGLLTLFCRHTSASLLVQENAAPEARADLERYFARIAPEDPVAYAHDDEGPDDMPAHLRAALTAVQLSIPLIGGRLALGAWQGLYLFEHRRRPHRRTIALHLLGE